MITTEIISSKIVPNNNDNCMICLDSPNLVEHSCSSCHSKALNVCQDCKDKLDTCPICRVKYNPINSPLEIHINVHHTIEEEGAVNNRPTIRNQNSSQPVHGFKFKLFEIFKVCGEFSRIPLGFFAIMFLGKIYVYIYCDWTCDKKAYPDGDGCQCYNVANRDNYWGDLSHFPMEFLIGIIVSALICGCCVGKN